MVDGSNLNVHYDASLSLFLSVPSKKGGDATLATLLVGTRARGGLRSGGSARTNFCTKERPTTHRALGGSMEWNWMSFILREKKISSVFLKFMYPKRCITKRLLLKEVISARASETARNDEEREEHRRVFLSPWTMVSSSSSLPPVVVSFWPEPRSSLPYSYSSSCSSAALSAVVLVSFLAALPLHRAEVKILM